MDVGTVVVIALALGSVPLFFAVVVRAGWNDRRWRDARSRRELTVALLLFITVFSAVIAGVVGRTLPAGHPLRLFVSGLPWGAIFVAGVTLLRVWRKR